MKKYVLALAAIAALPSIANAAPCRDAKGKFIKCPPAAAVPAPRAASRSHAVASHNGVAARKAPCRDSHGRFAKCR